MPLGITAHRLSGTKRGIDCHRVSTATQLGDDRLAPGPLHMKLIRLPLMMKTRAARASRGDFLKSMVRRMARRVCEIMVGPPAAPTLSIG